MRKLELLAVGVIGGLSVTSVSMGYEITTHALITDHAYRVSTLNAQAPDSIIPILGFDRLADEQPFAFQGQPNSTPYYDDTAVTNPVDNFPPVSSSQSVPRSPQNQERNVLNALVTGNYVSGASGAAIEQKVRAWLIRGAVREDDNDYQIAGKWTDGDDRDPDPYGRIFRAFRHFYDPLLDRASDHQSLCGTYGCVKSINWAIGRTAPLDPPSDADDTSRRQHFSWQDARNNYWWALTLKRTISGVTAADASVSSQERLHRWATTINDLGHVIHLLQDTAQPQHVRNDLHGPPITALFFPSEGAADGAFEAFTDYRVTRSYADASSISPGNPLRRMDDTLPVENSLPKIRLGQANYYPGGGGHVQFSTPVKFFTTRHIETGSDETSVRNRRGLADMSNRSFFTAGTLPGFRECQPVGASGCVPTPGPTYPLPPSDLTSSGYSEVSVPSGLRVHGRVVYLAEYAFPITDKVAPNYDQSVSALASYSGKAPLVTKGIWHDIVPDDLQPQYQQTTGYLLTYNNMRYMADVMVPRAVGYSAGMIDFFFRGRLEVTPIDQDIIAVMNQGDLHTVDSDGYPRQFANPARIFGFEKVRLRVRNVSADVVESGTGTVVSQNTGGADSRLVAIAKYHRNRCYAQDLSGERVRTYAGATTEPSCAGGVRTSIQEISVSAPLTVTAGELDTATPVEKLFDFSADPIPVNATDLFITVAYRGKLGDEADGIALGTYDVSEPTFVGFWNNTDYFWNGTNYLGQNATYPQRNAYTFYVCAGVPSKWLFRYGGAVGSVALGIPPTPGHLRLALIVGKPDNAVQRFPVRGVPIMQTSPHASIRSSGTRGQYRQASKELVAPSVLASPYDSCFVNPPPTNVDTWCFDPIQKRRGLLSGDVAQPIYWSTAGAGDGPDVDSVPLPAFASAAIRDGGEIKFNDAGALQNCPSQPALRPEDEAVIEDQEERLLLGRPL